MTEPRSSITVRGARARFFLTNDFGPDGGYDAPWAEAQFGLVRYRVPNLAARARALRLHDLHHLVTGYRTDWRGEAEISAWELGSGWGVHPYAWIIALFGFVTGLLSQPRATLHAFVLGRRSTNLYGRASIDDGLLDQPLASLTEKLGVPVTPPRARARDLSAFALVSIVALAFGLVSAPFVAVLVVLGELRRLSALVCCGCRAATA